MDLTETFIYRASTTSKLRHNNEVTIRELPWAEKAFYLKILKINRR